MLYDKVMKQYLTPNFIANLSYRTGPAAQAATAGPSGHLEGFLTGATNQVTTFKIGHESKRGILFQTFRDAFN